MQPLKPGKDNTYAQMSHMFRYHPDWPAIGPEAGPYIGELAHSVGLDGDVVLLELLLDFIDAGGDVLGLGRETGETVQCGQRRRSHDDPHIVVVCMVKCTILS